MPISLARFMRAMDQATVWANANPAKSCRFWSTASGRSAMLVGHRATFADKLVPAQIQPLIDIVCKYQKIPVFPASDLIFRA